ncbi:MAG TPA: 50S ribosomal protein L29 [archaeon]|nr:50S ribosomal protein L29 [archaeon]
MKEMEAQNLRKRLEEFKLELSKEKAQVAVGGAPKNPGRMRLLRRTVARLLTELQKRGIKPAAKPVKKEIKIIKQKQGKAKGGKNK